ncbi:ly-6/neurotoxin-like protein 1 [Monodelphis domestica]|uniref:ly-6/neurotoxin-like protein 1 n=1 Tax=Monodelphis domestica TaxID=13616 RepID=UPI00044323AE|nr:ly-6/neurotoxin-like protein 1 [Monodelphis domestica]
MKLFLPALFLLGTLCVNFAHSLECHVCCGPESCRAPVECSPTDKYCLITRAINSINPSHILVMKSCSPTCPNSTISNDGHAISVTCCQGNRCNGKGVADASTSLVISRGVLLVSVSTSLLWMLLRASW